MVENSGEVSGEPQSKNKKQKKNENPMTEMDIDDMGGNQRLLC